MGLYIIVDVVDVVREDDLELVFMAEVTGEGEHVVAGFLEVLDRVPPVAIPLICSQQLQ